MRCSGVLSVLICDAPHCPALVAVSSCTGLLPAKEELEREQCQHPEELLGSSISSMPEEAQSSQDWQALPAEVLAVSFSHISGMERRIIRQVTLAGLDCRYFCHRISKLSSQRPEQVCKRWRDVFDSSLKTLQPRRWNSALVAKFPYVDSLDCRLCSDQVCLFGFCSASLSFRHWSETCLRMAAICTG